MARPKNENIIFSLYLNKKIKTEFARTCQLKSVSMTAIINQAIHAYVTANKSYVEEHTDYYGNIITNPTYAEDDSENW